MNVAQKSPRAADSLPDITRHHRARYVKDARRLRAAEPERLFRAAGRGLAHVERTLSASLARRQLVRE